MSTRTFAADPPSSTRGIANALSRFGKRLRDAAAALAAWRRRRRRADRSLRAERELAGLSDHVLRDIGARDAAHSLAGAQAEARTSVLDLEMRG